jgi:hypothetical protein
LTYDLGYQCQHDRFANMIDFCSFNSFVIDTITLSLLGRILKAGDRIPVD